MSEDGDTGEIVLTITPAPCTPITVNLTVVSGELPWANQITEDRRASPGDLAQVGIPIVFGVGETQKTIKVTAVNDEAIELTETVVYVAFANGFANAVPVVVRGEAWLAIADNEWRWVDDEEKVSYQSATKAVDYHWYPDASYLFGSLDVVRSDSGEGSRLDTVRATMFGEFSDDAFTGAISRRLETVDNWRFVCNAQTGVIRLAPGPINGGGGTVDNDLKIELAGAQPVFATPVPNRENTVSVYIVGDAGIGGSFTTTVGGEFGISIGFESNETWAVNAGVFKVNAELVCRRGE